ncbi:unnamed protein product [Rangifer tarandus platyrhynchus]|uniref:Uncharacterized protein n=2 Tax=Rangifer tarandus platyrhynchus TaxID=3082113 RepID=A0ABN8Z022_RANTA|nr:unnamed protein product [Rangifer tarandus platyrhynchus]CAI9694307.1 unnamed protein product [Rangifer tarandus platyrhynchus]
MYLVLRSDLFRSALCIIDDRETLKGHQHHEPASNASFKQRLVHQAWPYDSRLVSLGFNETHLVIQLTLEL